MSRCPLNEAVSLASVWSSDAKGLLAERLAAVERTEIEKALRRFGGDTAAAAEALGVPRSSLYRRIKALGVVIKD